MDAKRILDRAAEQFSNDEDVLYLREESLLARSLHLLACAEAEYRRVPNEVSEKEMQRAKLDLNSMREKVCRGRLVRHPDHLELTIPLADALEGLDRSEEAIDYLRRAAQDPDLRGQANLKLGEIFERMGRVDRCALGPIAALRCSGYQLRLQPFACSHSPKPQSWL